MRASLDTNVIIHLYRAELQGILFDLFDEGVFIYEQIRSMELEHHGQDILTKVDSDINAGKIELFTDQKLKDLAVYKMFENNVRENRILYNAGDLGEVLKIMREETRGEVIDYIIDDNQINIEMHSNRILSIDRKEMENQADRLLSEIAIHSGSFELEDVAKFANGIKVTKIKAPSTDTTDISMQIEDIHTNYIRNVGFSIKSEIGNAPTLLNAGLTTNFIYKVTGISSAQANEINAIDTRTKIKDKMSKIAEYGGNIEYCGMNHDGFKRNLIMVDSSMPEIIGNMLLYFYTEDVKECDKLVDMLGDRDPLGYGDAMMYTYKFKKFLCSCALGMKPAKPWDGLDEANGGYIIVKADGEILAYHIYNRNFFEQYLLDNTILERASTSRHDYMSLYEENGEMFIKLNLQIRFR